MNERRFVPLPNYREYPAEEMLRRAREFATDMARRRTVRQFADRRVPRELIEQCILAAGSAPSGANKQPWHFVAIGDPEIKRQIREKAEIEEREFYGGRAPQEWLEALQPFGTDAFKPFLEMAPWLIAIFAQRTEPLADGRKAKNYYVSESVGLATGLLIAAVHHAGLVSLTHTPSPMGFLNEILGRPANETPFLLLVVGYPADDCTVPDIARKPLQSIATFV